MKIFIRYSFSIFMALSFTGGAFAQQVAPNAEPASELLDKEAIAKKLANPIANMISVPLQYQFSRQKSGWIRANLVVPTGGSI